MVVVMETMLRVRRTQFMSPLMMGIPSMTLRHIGSPQYPLTKKATLFPMFSLNKEPPK